MLRGMLIALALACGALTGCAHVLSEPAPTSPMPQSPAISVAREVFGDRLRGAGLRPHNRDSLVVDLRDSKLGETDPFVMLAAMARTPTESGVYRVDFVSGGYRVKTQRFTWDARNRTITWAYEEQSGSLATGANRGILSAVDTSTILAVAAGRQAVPTWRPWSGR